MAQSVGANSADILRVVDDWPEVVPIFGDELDAIETYLAPLLDELLGAEQARRKIEISAKMMINRSRSVMRPTSIGEERNR